MIKITADELVEAEKLLAQAKKEKAWLAKQLELVVAAAEQWGQRAMSAVRAGDDVIARDAFVRQSESAKKADELRAAHAGKRDEALRLEAALVRGPRAEGTKPLAKAPTFATTKPLAKTKGTGSEADSPPARAGASRERTKR